MGQALDTFGEVLTAPFPHLSAAGGTFLCLLASNMTALSGSSTSGWGILSFTAHEEQTGNEVKAHAHLQQLKKAKHFLFAKGEEQ